MWLASLPWYDFAEVRGALDELWGSIARSLVEQGVAAVPRWLDRDPDYEAQWNDPELLLGQACGYEVVLGYADRLRVVATPHFSFAGCDGPYHCSFVVVRAECSAQRIVDLRGLRCVINTPSSHPGMRRAAVARRTAAGRRAILPQRRAERRTSTACGCCERMPRTSRPSIA